MERSNRSGPCSDGTNLFMRQMRLDKQGVVQPPSVPHLFSAAGFLDDTWWHRTYWQFGTGMPGGYTRWFAAGQRRPAGRLMVMDRGMVLCDKVLFVAGPPDRFDVAPADAPHPYTPAAAQSLRSQREALAGKHGSLLWAVSADEGRKLSEIKLAGFPAWDGLIAARGRLYLTMQGGTARCLSGKVPQGPRT